ncbi:MAG: hypothetical protein NT117_08645 [Gammaproteobacteria bacterium]|nr:hypothetical protein [Gammaproteobacteria bacterium]
MAAVSIKLCLLFAVCAALPVQAEVLTARIASINTGAGTLKDVQVRLDWPRGAATGKLSLKAVSLDFPALSYGASQVSWQCPLLRSGADGWKCDGVVQARGSKPQKLAIEFSPEATIARLAIGNSRIEYRSPPALSDRHRVQLERVPVAWLGAFLRGLWAEGNWTGGQMGGSVDVISPDKGAFEVRTDLQLADVGLETPDGLLAAAGMKGRLQVAYRELSGARSVDARISTRGGELLFDSLYTKFPSSPVQVHVLAQQAPKGLWKLPEIQWQDAGVLVAKGSATLDAQSSVSDLSMAIDFANLGIARDRYLSGFLAPAGFSDLLLTGGLQAGLQMRAGQLTGFEAILRQVNAVDTKARFTLAGIDGDLRWTRAGAPVASRVQWRNGAIFGIGLGAADFRFNSAGGELVLGPAVPIEALGGRLVLDHLRWQAPEGEAGARFQFGLGMQELDLASLSQRLGWPAFTGTISGKIPSARFQDDLLTLDGGLQMNLFGGSINLAKLSMERPFGVAPTLSADVGIQDIDLEPMTKVFGFGSITGRLDGRINDLRLVDWSPVAFDARLETDRDWKGKQRISQRAVNDISSVGGSGLAGSLQTRVLKVFDDFGYARIGLGCKLKDNVCTMDGIGSAGDGYIIVEGAGLPRIQVVGFRRRVDWPTLVARLQAATSGQAPVIQ